MIRVVVVEDEFHSKNLLLSYLREVPEVVVVGEACNGLEGLKLIHSAKPDAVFLDIQMPGCSGLDLARNLPDPAPRLVFVTAHPEHAVEAFRLAAAHYLLKPVNRVDLGEALERLFPAEARREGWLRIPVRRKGNLRFLMPEDLHALVADLGDCLAWTEEGPLRVEGTLVQWESRLAPCGFLRVHRNALVRLEAVRELRETGELVLPTGTLCVSRRNLETLKRALNV